MKRIVLIRHGKAAMEGKDHERNLMKMELFKQSH